MPIATVVTSSTRTLAFGLVSLAGLVALVWLAWPHPADADVLQAYGELERSPVPVEVLGWITPSQARAQVLQDGYVLSLRAERLGDVTISGRRGAAPSAQNGLTWQEGDVTYAVQTTADPRLVQARVVPLDDARKQFEATPWDTPVLYLGYLPAFIMFGLWVTRSLLSGSSHR